MSSSATQSLFNVVQSVQKLFDKEESSGSVTGSFSVSRQGSSLSSLDKFKMAAIKIKALQLKQQNQLNLQEHMHKLKGPSNLLLRSVSARTMKETSPAQEEIEEEEEEECIKEAYDSNAVFHDLSDHQIEAACSSALKHYFDLESLQTDQENKAIFEYIREVFDGLIQTSFQSFAEEGQKISLKEKVLVLKCKIIKANDLLAKDSNGKSDPYCILTVLNKEHIDSKLVRHHNVEDWLKEEIVQKSSKTSTQEKTLDPVWNETFEFPISEPQDHYLVAELWDSDEDQRQNPKGFRRFANLKKEDDFLGRVFYLLQHLPVGGGEKVLNLMSHSAKHSRGTLTVWMDIVGQRKDKSPEEAELCFRSLLECVIIKESTVDNEHVRRWKCNLPESAERLLVQNASINRISPLHQAAIRLSVLLRYHSAHAVDVSALSGVLSSIQSHESELVNSRERPLWAEQLVKDLREVFTFIMDIMKVHLDIFNNFKSNESINLLKGHLLVLHDLYQLQLFKGQLSNEQLDIKAILTKAIQSAVPHWMTLLLASITPSHSSPEDIMTSFKAFCTHCLKQCQRSYDKVHPVFMELGVDYFSPFFTSLDKILHGEAISRLETGQRETALLTYEIYQAIQEMSKFADKVDPEFLKRQQLSLAIVKFHIWFKGCVSDWIGVAQTRAKQRLTKAVELDTIVVCHDTASFSSSAVDAHAFFLQVISFWKDLSWPDRAQSLGYFIIIIQSLVDMSTFYSQAILEKLSHEDYTDDQSRFVVTEKLCITLNNMHHVREVLNGIEVELNLESYYQWLDEDKQVEGPPLSERAKTLVKEVLQSANDDLLNKLDSIVGTVQRKISPIVLEFIPKMMSAPPDTPPDKVLEPMIDYISENMGKLGQALLTPIFLNILRYLWGKVVAALKQEYEKVPHTSVNPLHVRLNYILLNLSDFFEANGNGLRRVDIESETYMTLRDNLLFAVLTTEDVIRRFCYELVKQQVYAKELFGKLHMSHIYHSHEKTLAVDIVSAEDIPALDRSGKSDPFVQLLLLPSFAFPLANDKVHKTAVKKQTLNPVFNETIKLPVPNPDQLTKPGSILLMAMFDHDTIGSNDFAGLCAVTCNSTPLEGTEPKIEHLNLFHYETTPSFKELELRNSDQEAQEFLKQMKKFVFEEETNSDHPFHRLLHKQRS